MRIAVLRNFQGLPGLFAAEARGVASFMSQPHKTQLYLVPGFNMRPRPGMTLRVGVQVPVTTAKSFDYRFLSALVMEF